MDKYAEDVTIYRQDGQCVKTRALVQKDKIFVEDVTIPISIGDVIERVLPSGITERYTVINTTCYAGSHHLAHWELEYKKEGTERYVNQGLKVIGGIHANRVYIQSTDNSTNITNQMDKSVFEELRRLIEEKIENNSEILKALSEFEENIDKPTRLEKFNNFIQVAANYMTIIAPFIPVISDMMAKN